MFDGYDFHDNYHDDDESGDFFDFEALYNTIESCLKNNESRYIDLAELEDTVEYYLFDNINKALTVTDYALKIFPDSTSFMLYKAEILIEKGQNEKAFEILNNIETLEPYNARVYTLRAGAYMDSKQTEKAIAEYHRALINEVDEPSLIYEELAYSYLSLKNEKDALKCYKKCIELEKENPEPYYFITDIFINLGQTSEGIFYFDSLLQKDGENINALFAMGKLLEREGLHKKALNVFDKVLAHQNDHFEALFEKIHIFKIFNKYQEVIDICKQYKDVFFPYFVIELAKTYSEMGHTEETLEIFIELYKKQPEDLDVIIGIAESYFKADDLQKSLNYTEAGLLKYPESIELLLIKAQVFQAQNKTLEALDLTNIILEKLDLDIFSQNEFKLSELYFEMDRVELVIDFLSAFLNTDPFNAKLHYLLASAHYLNHNESEAYNSFETGLSLSYNDYAVFFDKCMLAHTDDTIYDLLEKYNKKNN